MKLHTAHTVVRPQRTLRLAAVVCALLPTVALAQERSSEERTARYFDAVRGQTPLLIAFLREMPKGADLHNHLSGAVYAESFLRWAAEDKGCVSRRGLFIINAPCAPPPAPPAPGAPLPDTVPATAAIADATLYGTLIDAFSMRNWQPARINGHDQFFATFGRFNSQPRRTGDMLAEAVARAASGNVSYMELMQTLDGRGARTLGQQVGWNPDFRRMRDTLLAVGIQNLVAVSSARADTIEARRDTVLACHTAAADPGCKVTARWIYQVSRANPPEQVFAQILLGFLLTQRDSRVVGFNLVQPEDNQLAMKDYSLQMRMIGFLQTLYPGVKVSLHAGELAPGLVPPEGLRFHVREAVEVAGASRIGHGVDVMNENRPHELLAEMAQRHVMVEINLTSNDVILGVSGKDHPLRAYLAAGVPVALSTDDEGVARSEMTLEYVRAARDQGLSYPTLKKMARTSLQYAFAADTTKTRLQRELESAFTRFETRYGALPIPAK